ncbi:MAG: hypothetical protein LBR64_04940 [Dysgonamonadaceae bacterium]|jgi:hypothetical protein|nr:hypothetical protein [Dysgonamonadaceae bacterium]
MKKMKVLFAVSLIILMGCEDWFIKDEEFLKAIPYSGIELRTDDGYFFSKTSNNPEEGKVLFFYRNGAVFGGNYNYETGKLQNPEYLIDDIDNIRFWGTFSVSDNTLKYQFYSIFNGHYWRICEAQCNILNDTTFVRKKIFLLYNGKDVTDDFNTEITFHFRQFSPKPYSTNTFIK